jgi:hypothetical protein
MLEALKVADPLTQRGFEGRPAAELFLETKQLQRRRRAVVEHQQPVAQGV